MKMTAIVDQPPPRATDRRPSWEIVMSYVDQIRHENAYDSSGVIAIVLADMRERDAVGRQRYSIPLTSGNGRDHLVDAYQELLDGSAYMATELDEHGVGPASNISEHQISDPATRWRMYCIQQLFASQIRALIQLRALIEERSS